MKNLTKALFLVLSIGLMVGFYSCSDDDDDNGGGSDPNVFCDENLCATDSALKQQCINAFYECIENNPDANDDECVATALLICKL